METLLALIKETNQLHIIIRKGKYHASCGYQGNIHQCMGTNLELILEDLFAIVNTPDKA